MQNLNFIDAYNKRTNILLFNSSYYYKKLKLNNKMYISSFIADENANYF